MPAGIFEVNPGVFMEATCHHRQHGACGACYARLVNTLERIQKCESSGSDVQDIVVETFKAMQAEARRPARKRRES